jgi:hypothetical protein
MVSISEETTEETHTRLRAVIGRAELQVFDGDWSFFETAIDEPPALSTDVLAVVRDESSWSALRRADDADGVTRERFGLVSFHFPDGADNSGFVGWLATELKSRLGTGVFVVCGSNSAQGGIYDYWGYPAELREGILAAIRDLGRAKDEAIEGDRD